MNLPREVISRLQPMFPALNLGAIEVRLVKPTRIAACRCCPHAYITAGASPYPGLIEINPAYWDPDGIPGLRLIAHEVYHQAQQRLPGFDALYEALAVETETAGRQPWQHPMEVPAYEFEGVIGGAA